MSWLFMATSISHTLAQAVGINQPNPDWPLDILAPQAVARLITTGSGYGSVVELKNNTASAEYLGAINFNDPGGSYPGQISYKSNHIMSFRVGHQERMTIANNGNIGIGTQNPNYDIDIQGSQSIINLHGSDYYGSQIFFKNADPEASFIGAIRFYNWGGYGGSIFYNADHSLQYYGDAGLFLTIDATGRMGIKRQPATNVLEVEGNASKSSAGDWLANSDARLKKNIRPLDSEEMLEKVLELKGIFYEWNDDKTGGKRPEGIQFGFTAQNIQESFPTLVEEDGLGYLQTAYGTFDPMMVEALRALNDKIQNLEAVNADLVTENAEMKAEISEIKKLIKSQMSDSVMNHIYHTERGQTESK